MAMDFWAEFAARSRDVPVPDLSPLTVSAEPLPDLGRSATLWHAELSRIAERFWAASERFHEAAVAEQAGERDRQQGLSWEAMTEYHAAGLALADLQLLLLRQGSEYRADEVRVYLLELLRPELESLFTAIAGMEKRQ